MKKKFLSRIARRKDSAPAKPGEGHEIPPPTAIEPGVPYSTEDTEGKSYGSHMELELLAADEPPRTDLTNGVDARENDPAPAVESLTAPASGEPPDAAETPREAAPFEEYGLDLEPLGELEAGESPDEAETSGQDVEAFPVVAESVTEAIAAEPEIPRESEPEAVADIVSEHEEAATDAADSPVEATASEPQIPQESEAQAIGDAVPEDEEPLAAASANESPDAPEPSREAAPFEEYGLDLELLTEPGSGDAPGEPDSDEGQDEAVPVVEESAAEATAPEPEIPLESESEPADNIVQEVGEPLAASAPEASPDESEPPRPDPSREDEAASHSEVFTESPPEQTDEPPETSPVENGFLPLVRDSRGNWRPGKGFSRSELREAGLSLAGAARLRIRVDKRRRNAHPVNVATLEKAKSGA